jgi:hypothetical protein
MNYWPINFTNKAIVYSLTVTLGISTFFLKYFMPVELLLAGLLIIIFFFFGLNYYSKNWRNLPYTVFEKKLFFFSLLFRLIFVFYMYLLTSLIEPLSFPFELGAADSWLYHGVAQKLANNPLGEYFKILNEQMQSKSDFGFPIFQSLIYKVFGGYTFPVRLINCILGSYTVVYLSRLSYFIFNEAHAKLTGIIAMLFPSLLWFSAIQLKETLMLFMIVTIFYHAIRMNEQHRIRLKSLLTIILLSFFLFYFRTFLAVLTIISVLVYYTLSSLRILSLKKVLIISCIFLGSIILVNKGGINKDIGEVYTEGAVSGYLAKNLNAEARRVGNINYEQTSVTPMIVLSSFITPFPTLLNTEPRQIRIIAHFQNEIVRNLIYYFALLGLIIIVKNHLRQGSILVFFISGYLYVITNAGNSFQDRFHLVMIPFIIVAVSVGMIQSSHKWIQRWNWYLVFIFIVHLSWTIFKLDIRGL